MSDMRAKDHVEHIRKNKFSIGANEPNPLTEDLHHAVKCLSAELYTKDLHFLMELIQNAEDNVYDENVEPTLEFALTTEDITGSNALMTLLVFNNEIGFMRQHMESICSVGRSTKKGRRGKGFIGEKGIGFKSVFLVSKHPHIISNGYKVKFSEEPNKNCGIGYIVPEWISNESLISKIRGVYGSGMLPTTTIILPLKEDKIIPVKQELASLHPELLLFLSKLRRLYVHENHGDPEKVNSVTAISIVSEAHHVVIRDKQADSRVVHLSVKEKPDVPEEKCQYYIWRQAFQVKPEAKVIGRTDVEEWIVSLAFPFGNRLKRGTSSVGIFAFLPTSMVTNFPFVIQADFILASSRETVVLDSKWNLGILECVPYAFVNAFMSCVLESSPVFTIAQAFEYLPAQSSPFPELNKVREAIRIELTNALIVPCETFTSKVTFCKPSSAVRILTSFRELLFKMKEAGVSLASICRMKISLVHSSLDEDKYGKSLEFLGVQFTHSWYENCITACDLVSQAPDDLYIDLVYFVFHNRAKFTIKYVPLIKFINKVGKVKLSTISEIQGGQKVLFGENEVLHAWLQKCNMLFGCSNNTFLLPNSTQASLKGHPKGLIVSSFFQSHGIKSCSAAEYASQLCGYVSRKGESSLVLRFCHFLFHCKRKKFLSESDVSYISKSIPIIDGSGCVRVQRTETLVRAEQSKWTKLFGPVNPFLEANYVDIGEAYAVSGMFAGKHTPENALLKFITVSTRARDLPEISPPNLALEVVSTTMTCESAFFLLDWLRFHITRGSKIPQRFIDSIRFGKWVTTKSGVDCPNNCAIPDEIGKSILELMRGVVFRFSVVDEDYYGNKINSYSDELKFLGVRCGVNDVQDIVKDHFKQCVGSSWMSRETAFSIFVFMDFLKNRKMMDELWLNTIRQREWIKTCRGFAAPCDSVYPLSDLEAEALMKVTSLHAVDVKYYGEKLHSFLDELKLLGVKTDLEVYAMAVENLSFPVTPLPLTSSCGFFLLKCMRHEKLPTSSSIIRMLQSTPWLKTNFGFKCPSEAILNEVDVASLLNTFNVPVIDEDFYGDEIRSYIVELKAVGVGVEFEDVQRIFVKELKSLLSSHGTPEHFIALLECMSKMKTGSLLLDCMCTSLQDEEILKTRHGYKKARESILFNSKWASISVFVDLPLIDDSYYGIKIYGFKDELKCLGVLSSLEEGAIFVARGLSGPIASVLLTAQGTLCLLDCLKILMASENENLSVCSFIENMKRSELLMTSRGYRLPQNSLFLQSSWEELLDLGDASFIDDKFYGTEMKTYLIELQLIGVKISPVDICNVISTSLPRLAETPPIKRIYRFLKEFQWKPNSSETKDLQIWIPGKEEQFNEGEWVDSRRCVIHHREHYFSLVLYSLDAYYEKEMLPFFNTTYGVREFPATSHYLQIWSLWEAMEAKELLEAECCFFWGYILKNWNSETRDILTTTVTKVPAFLPNKVISLARKENVFVPDDLYIKKMFMSVGDSPLFVWSPKSCTFSGVREVKLWEVYYALGVRKLSDSVRRTVSLRESCGQQNNSFLKEKQLIVKGLIEIVLGFLSSKIHMPIQERHEAAKLLLNLSVFKSDDNIMVSYRLNLNAHRCLETKATKLVHWDKKSQQLFIDRKFSENLMKSAEFVFCFAEEITEGLLAHERSSTFKELRNLIQIGCLLEFQDDEVKFLLTRENIELSMEDEKFLAAMFIIDAAYCGSPSAKRASSEDTPLGPLTPFASQSVKRRRFDELAGSKGRLRAKSTYHDNNMTSQTKMATKKVTIVESIKPKRPFSAFFLFKDELSELFKSAQDGIKSDADDSQNASELWKAMSDDEKAPFIKLAEEKKDQHNKEMEAYHRKMVEAEITHVKDEPQSDVGDGEDEGNEI